MMSAPETLHHEADAVQLLDREAIDYYQSLFIILQRIPFSGSSTNWNKKHNTEYVKIPIQPISLLYKCTETSPVTDLHF